MMRKIALRITAEVFRTALVGVLTVSMIAGPALAQQSPSSSTPQNQSGQPNAAAENPTAAAGDAGAQAQEPASTPDAQQPANPENGAPAALPGAQPAPLGGAPTATGGAPGPATPLTLGLGPDYSHGKSWFPRFWEPYTPPRIDHPQFVNTPKIDQLIHDGKLYLSLRDAIALALQNSVDISVAEYGPWIAQTDILRTLSGGAARGASGTGTAQVLGTVPNATFDPIITSQLYWERAAFPVNNPLLSGTGVSSAELFPLINYTAVANFTYSQAFHTGTSFSVSFNNTRGSSNSPESLFNPYVQSNASIFIQQPLLNGFGLQVNTRFIVEARNSEKIAESQLEQQVMTTITAVQNDYWELVYDRQNVNVQAAAVNTSQNLYNNNEKQVQIGTLAPIEVTRANSQLATDQQNMIVAQTVALQEQTVLLNAIAKNPMAPELQNLEVVPTDDIPAPPPAAGTMSLQESVNEAWANRPELKQARISLKNMGIEVKATRNSLLPIVNAYGQYIANGLGGNLIETAEQATTFTPDLLAPVVDSNGNPVQVDNAPVYIGTPLNPTLSSTVLSRGGLGDDLQQIGNNRFPTYLGGLNITLPIRNRSAQADAARALLNERQAQTTYQQTQNSIMLDVRNAMIALQQDRARVDAAARASVLAQQTLDAEQKKFQLGASTTFLVIQDQKDLTAAQGTELRARADLIEAQVNYEKALGTTLEVNDITVGDAKARTIYKSPNIPGTPASQLPGGSSR